MGFRDGTETAERERDRHTDIQTDRNRKRGGKRGREIIERQTETD